MTTFTGEFEGPMDSDLDVPLTGVGITLPDGYTVYLGGYEIKDGDDVRVETVDGDWKLFVNGVEAKPKESL